ncbi:NAD(P)/FAD-dependent oxidoreductase [Prosthecomicrobium hirschii]|uniref:NAD(P)/FAD-dependent oxidoreductase n=1 Tax=Prosthecodimorpha hirschii TaxID=665126 RepID=UPI0022200C3B|nr:FAD-binding oxidoreductase [Prosthecomicrobium hirschii]MCW1839673.1 FAD-binding oxidoreductase [Prosthecomicrobium hirschii]
MSDVIVLGAGMVGVSAALHLAMKGRSVVLVDRRDPGEETSYGNTGIVEREGYIPVTIPKDPRALLRYALNQAPEANYHLSHLPKVAGWLMQLWSRSNTAGVEAYAADNELLCRHAVPEHRALAAAAGAERYFRQTGWIRLYRSPASFAGAAKLFELCDRYGVAYRVMDADGLAEIEPHLARIMHKAAIWPETDSVSWPAGVTKAYAARFQALGGRFVHGDARSLTRTADGWSVVAGGETVTAREVVVALGPWTGDILAPLGLKFPLIAKRGYHMHFGATGNAVLNHPIVDVEHGFCLTPMEKGIRLTTAVEFADRDAPPTPRQLEQLKPIARALFPLAEERDETPWLGRRPALPDSLPVIGRAPGVPGMWLDFGHGHLGFTQGPISGRLIAEAMTGQTPLVDLRPFRAERFFGA